MRMMMKEDAFTEAEKDEKVKQMMAEPECVRCIESVNK